MSIHVKKSRTPFTITRSDGATVDSTELLTKVAKMRADQKNHMRARQQEAEDRVNAESSRRPKQSGDDDGDGDGDDDDEADNEEEVDEETTQWMKQKYAELEAAQVREERRAKQRVDESMRARAEQMVDEYMNSGPVKSTMKAPHIPKPKDKRVRSHMIMLMDASVQTRSRRKIYTGLKGSARGDITPDRLPRPLILALRKSDDPTCEWNTKCSRLFAIDFLEAHKMYNMIAHGVQIKKMFITYLTTLRTHYQEILNPSTQEEKAVATAANNRASRGNKLMNSRTSVLSVYESALLPLLPSGITFRHAFSRDNTSDDELLPDTDNEDQLVFKIEEFVWRDRKATEFLHALDKRIRALQAADGETQTRTRRKSKVDLIRSSRGPCRGLPIDWYDENWINNLKKNNLLAYAELNVAPPAHTKWDQVMALLAFSSD
ncbi:hypothetical protein BKA62DRAFT_822386 [Auriculariales sp. MPI-PUGE-AT-0066]|nr:hypothetical protein BKA62DRAFT_822386 [Auriculariales sp. MPI-PUGE-AT-0066]